MGNHVKFARFVLLPVSEEAKVYMTSIFFFIQCIIKQLLLARLQNTWPLSVGLQILLPQSHSHQINIKTEYKQLKISNVFVVL